MIYRASIPVTDYSEVMTHGGRIISAEMARDDQRIDVWFELGDNKDAKLSAIYVFGTGHTTPWTAWSRDNWKFINTIVAPNGLVWHVYWGPRKGEPIPS